MKPYMVQQVIKYSDGTETIINYREKQGMENEEQVEVPVVEESAPEAVEAVEVVEVSEEVVVEEAPAESVEESA